MSDSILFNSPFMLLGFLAAILIFIFDMIKKPKSAIPVIISVLIVVAIVSYSLIMGASLQEVLIIMLIFSALALGAFKKREG